VNRMNPEQFTWQRWRADNITSLGLLCREWCLISNRGIRILREYGVGYCKAESLRCRPKENCTAVMFFFNGHHFWTHLTNKEFNIAFGDLI